MIRKIKKPFQIGDLVNYKSLDSDLTLWITQLKTDSYGNKHLAGIVKNYSGSMGWIYKVNKFVGPYACKYFTLVGNDS